MMFCPDAIEDIFISEYSSEDGTRTYESIFWFSSSYILEAKQFTSQYNFDITPLNAVIYYELQAQEYDFERATDRSRLTVNARFGALSMAAQLRGSKQNCNYLKNIIVKYLKNNINACRSTR